MTWPDGWSTVTVTGDYTAAGPSGSVASGTVEFDTVPARLASSQYGVIAVGTIVGTLAGGLLSVTLAATDSLTNLPFVWRVTEQLTGQPVRSYYISLPAGTSPVNLATAVYTGELPASYTVITGPQGLQGVKGDKGNDGGGGNYDPAGSAAAALVTAEAYTDTHLATEVTRADGAYDHTGAASTAAAAALASAHTYADTGDAITLAAAEAYTDAHAGGGGGSYPIFRQIRIKNEIIALTSAASWTVVATTDATKLACSIPAAAGDQIIVSENFMRTLAALFLDVAILKADGVTPSEYAGSGMATHLDEGEPALYPDAAHFPGVVGLTLFVVQAEQVTAGHVTVALVYQGTADGSQRIYAHPQYPWRMLVGNFGPSRG